MVAERSSCPRPGLPFPAALALAAPNLATGALLMALSIYLPRFYAGHVGLGLAAVGIAIMVVRLVDIAVDPLIGVAMDRTRTRVGRFRPWIGAGVPVLLVSVFKLFGPPTGASASYLVLWVFAFYLGISLIMLAQYSWAATLVSDYDERSRVFGALQFVFVAGATAAIVLPILYAANGGAGGDGAIRAMGWFGMVTATVGVVVALAVVPERITTARQERRLSMRSFLTIISRSEMRRIVAADFCLELGTNWMAALYLFYFQDALGFTIADASALLLIYVGAGLAGAPGLSRIATRLGKHRTVQVASTGFAAGLLGLAFLPRGDMWMGGAFMFVMGFLASGFPLLNRAMVADVGDAIRLEHGRASVGLLYAMVSTDQKIARALSIGLSFTLLGWLGYHATEGVTNTPDAIRAMGAVFLTAPFLFVLLGAACYLGYGLTAARHAEIRVALDRLEGAELAANPASEVTATTPVAQAIPTDQ